MKYHWIDKGYSFKTHIHILPSMYIVLTGAAEIYPYPVNSVKCSFFLEMFPIVGYEYPFQLL